jgi:hypothetical protein
MVRMIFSAPGRRRPDAMDGTCTNVARSAHCPSARHARVPPRSRTVNSSDKSGNSARETGSRLIDSRATGSATAFSCVQPLRPDTGEVWGGMPDINCFTRCRHLFRPLLGMGALGTLRLEQRLQFGPQLRFQSCRGGRPFAYIDRLRQAHDAIDCRQRCHAKQFSRHAFDRVARHRARRQALGCDDAQAGMRQLIGACIENEVRGPVHRSQTKNG